MQFVLISTIDIEYVDLTSNRKETRNYILIHVYLCPY